MAKQLIISHPHMGDYHIPIKKLVQDLIPEATVLTPPPITRHTIELGSRYSPDYVCSPFKYNMGNYIEALGQGANVLLQTGMGCRYGYYGEVQQQILQDLGHDFRFICLSRGRARLNWAYNACKELNPLLSPSGFLRAILLAVNRIRYMDKLDYYLRENIGFESRHGDFERQKKAFLSELELADSAAGLRRVYTQYREAYRGIPLDKPEHPLRVGVVGELYTLMEPESNFLLERQLAEAGAVVSRRMSASFLLFGKHDSISLRKSKDYLTYTVGANGVDSVSQCLYYAKRGYDGVLHIKSFGCTPELNAQPALSLVGSDYDMPILHLSFDSHTSETGIRTRVEAFTDMIAMKRDKLQ